MRKLGWVASSLIAFAIFPCASRAESSIDLNKYTCAQFLADTANKADGKKLARSLMMNSWAVGYATARQKTVPLADSEAIGLIAASLRNACRNAPNKTIARAIVHVIDEFSSASAQSKTPAKGPVASGLSVYWSHNGSLVSLVSDGAKQKIYYQAPRIGLVDAGVKTGSLLFEGQKNGPAMVGTAYQFYRSCKPRGYQVSGNTSEDRRQITLKGKAPLLDSSCNITGSRDDVLIFAAYHNAPKELPKNTQVAGAPTASARTPSSAGAANNSAVAGAVVPSAPAEASRVADIPVIESGNTKSGDPSTPSSAVSAAGAVTPSEPPKDKEVTIDPEQQSGTVPPSEPAKDTQLAAAPQNASTATNSSAAESSAAPSGEPANDNQPGTIPGADSATPMSDVSNTGSNQAQQSAAAPPSEPPKDTQIAALPGAVGAAAKTDDASKVDANKAKNSGAPRNSRAARKSEASGADADKTGVLPENRTLPTNAPEKMMEIVLKNGRVLRIGRDIDPESLLRIISLLER